MQDEYDAVMQKCTWSIVPPPPGANIVSGKWIFRHEFNSSGSLSHLKACWVVWGFTHNIPVSTSMKPLGMLSDHPPFEVYP
jgi:hypothetical protein